MSNGTLLTAAEVGEFEILVTPDKPSDIAKPGEPKDIIVLGNSTWPVLLR